MALINQPERWFYLLEPHTASRSTSQALQGLGGVEVGGWHANLKALYASKLIPNPVGYEVGVTVRNPLDVLITKWLKSRYPKMSSLREWMGTIDPSFYSHPLSGLWKSATTICWFEHLEDDLRFIFNEPELKVAYDPKHKCKENPKQPKRYWWQYMEEDTQTLDIVLKLYADFMEMFGYHYAEQNGRPHMFINQDTRNDLRRQIR